MIVFFFFFEVLKDEEIFNNLGEIIRFNFVLKNNDDIEVEVRSSALKLSNLTRI